MLILAESEVENPRHNTPSRQQRKDRLRGQLDYEVDRRAESEVQGLARKLDMIHEEIGDLHDPLREHITLRQSAES